MYRLKYQIQIKGAEERKRLLPDQYKRACADYTSCEEITKATTDEEAVVAARKFCEEKNGAVLIELVKIIPLG